MRHFFVGGFPKCGTTALHEYLDQHPDICMSQPKETHFLTSEHHTDARYFRDTYFAHHAGEAWLGESTPDTYFQQPELVHTLFAEARFVALLRDPVQRAWSHWWHQTSLNHETRPFPRAIRDNLARGEPAADSTARAYLERGQYATYLKRFLRTFDRAQLHLCWFDDLCRDAARETMAVHRFLELEPIAPSDIEPKNVARGRFWSPLARLIPQPFHYGRIGILTRGLHAVFDVLGDQRPEPDLATVALLKEYYEPHDAELEALLGEVPSWKRRDASV